MRLLRRTLLSLLVGVTAFGVAGWLLRPKPTWSVPLGERSSQDFLSSDAASPEDPIWVEQFTGDGLEARAYRVVDGALLTVVPFSRGWDIRAAALTDGRLLIEQWFAGDRRETELRLIDAGDRTKDADLRLPGRWYASRSGRHAVQARRTPRGLECHVAELPSGCIMLHRVLQSNLLEDGGDLSADGRLLAVQEASSDSPAPSAVEVWDLIAGDRVRRLEFPAKERRGLFGDRPKWLDDGRLIECKWGSAVPGDPFVFWRLDVDRGTVRKLGEPPAAPPPGADPEQHLGPYHDDATQREVWCAMTFNDQTMAFTVLDDRNVLLPWRPFPFPLTEGASWPMRRTGRFLGIDVHFVPGADALVWRTEEPPLAASLPTAIYSRLPESWRLNRIVHRTRWFDWARSGWRDVGLSERDAQVQVRRDALYALVQTEAREAFLESYPLPPRDPRPPALAIAVLSTLATWSLCAWRYRQRTAPRQPAEAAS